MGEKDSFRSGTILRLFVFSQIYTSFYRIATPNPDKPEQKNGSGLTVF